ncbi:MAG: ROK family protein, partial [Sphingomonadales bacterium]
MLGAIEAGGTKFVLAVGPAPDRIMARHVIPTRAPETTLVEAMEWFAGQGRISALGIGSFGPVDLDRQSPRWGFITATPKPGWSDCDFAGYLGQALNVPVGFETDVNAAA